MKRILVIDDEEPIQEVICGCLEDLADWQVFTAASGIEGLQMAISEPLDGILLDISMPKLDGIEVLRLLKTNPRSRAIPVVLLTARVQPEDQARFAALPIAGVISKPFDPLTLVDQVAEVLGWEV